MPIVFEENSGQAAPDVRFLTRQGDLTSWFALSEIVFGLGNRGRDTVPGVSTPHARPDPTVETPSRRSVVRMRLVGANPAPRVVGLDPLPGAAHYLIGSDPAHWRTHVRQYRGLAYRDVYPGIDLVFHSRGGRLEYDFEVQPGVDEDAIELAFDGMDDAGIEGTGDLVLRVPGGQLRHRRPTSVETGAADDRPVESSFVRKAHGRFGFRVVGRDRHRRLRIDPELEWIRLPGADNDWAYDVVVDNEGNTYVSGMTSSADFPSVGGMPPGNLEDGEAFVLKLGPDRQIIYSTFFGAPGEADIARGISLDAQGRAIVAGNTFGSIAEVSAAHPGMCAADLDGTAFLAMLAVDGASFSFSTCLPAEVGEAVALDPVAVEPRGVTVTGWTANDAFLGRYLLDGSRVFSRTWGGSSWDMAFDVAVDSDRRAFVVGGTNSRNLPGTAEGLLPTLPSEGGFVAAFAPTGALERATYLGGAGGRSRASGVALDRLGNVYVTGWTRAADFPLAGASMSALRDSPWGPVATTFVTKLRPNLRELVYSTFYAQPNIPVDGTVEYVDGEEGLKLAADSVGNAWVIGESITFNDATYFTGVFPWLAGFDPAGQPAISVLLDLTSNGDEAYGIAVAGNGDIYIVGHVDYLWECVWVPDVGQRCYTVSDSDVFIIRIPGQGDEIVILPTTTRWKPQRDDSENIKVDFKGPSNLDVSTVRLEVTTPGGPATYAPTWTATTKIAGRDDEYTFEWTGPWAYTDATGTHPLPRGSYQLVVAVKQDGSSEEIRNETPYNKVSLVEVTGVKLAHLDGTAFETNPRVGWSDDEEGAEVRRVERPGGGFRIFAEADAPGGTPHDRVAVTVTTDPTVPAEVTVYLSLLDVADPDGTESAGSAVADNFGIPVPPPGSITVPAGEASAAVSFRASHQPGDNYRVVASTSSDWLGKVKAYQPSFEGEVRDDANNTLAETSDAAQAAQLSKMLTVWRRLHLEIDSMARAPADTETDAEERNFIEGEILRIEGRDGNARRVYVNPTSPPGMNGLSDESRDRCSPPARPVGNGRFEGGDLRIGRGEAAQSVDVFANGTDFVEPLPSGFYIYARLRDGSDNILCTAVVVSSPAGFNGNNSLCTNLWVSDPEGLGSFDLRLPQCSWGEVAASATKLEIGGVAFEIAGASSVRTEGEYQLATVVVRAGVMLPFRLVDDDVTPEAFPVSVSLLQDSDDPNTNVLAAAYVRPRPLVYEDKKTARFRRNVAAIRIGPDTIISPQADEVREEGKEDGFHSSADYWVAYLQGAFQEGEAWDNDASDEIAAYGLTRVGKALIFAESLRDNAEFSEGDCSPLTPPHEIGHMFGLEDTLTLRGLMSYSCDAGNAFFRPEHLREIRKGVIQ